eukprot:949767-Rhodomonas_salina.1
MEVAAESEGVLDMDRPLSDKATEQVLCARARACTWTLVSRCLPALRVVLAEASESTAWGWRPRGSAAEEAEKKREVMQSGFAVVCGWIKLGLGRSVANAGLVPMMVDLMRKDRSLGSKDGRAEKEWEKGLGGKITDALITLWATDGARDH